MSTPPSEGAPVPGGALHAARASGLIEPGEPLVVLLSGGADSVCLLDVAGRLGAVVSALHVNYGLRPEAAADERFCRELCEALAVPLTVEEAELGDRGNVQARARAVRHDLGERLARAAGGHYATAHTRSDQAETVLYRLATSPGRRALLGMPARRGRLVRPLLEVARSATEEHCRAHGLRWREDASNADRRFARARIRHDVLPTLRELNPEVERTVAETSRLLRDEAEALDAVVQRELARMGAGTAPLPELRRAPRALARLAVRRLAEDAAGGSVALSRAAVEAILALDARGGTASLDVGGGLRAVVEYGVLRFTRAAEAPLPEPVTLPVPGAARFGPWEVRASLGEAAGRAGPDEVALDPGALGGQVTVRGWREGDRMAPVGLGGTRSLADLFTDRKVPRALRRELPVIEAGGEVAWVAGVAVGERFRARPGESRPVSVSARRASAS